MIMIRGLDQLLETCECGRIEWVGGISGSLAAGFEGWCLD